MTSVNYITRWCTFFFLNFIKLIVYFSVFVILIFYSLVFLLQKNNKKQTAPWDVKQTCFFFYCITMVHSIYLSSVMAGISAADRSTEHSDGEWVPQTAFPPKCIFFSDPSAARGGQKPASPWSLSSVSFPNTTLDRERINTSSWSLLVCSHMSGS